MSLYRGIVTDTNDPEGLVRVKARVPLVYGQAESDWMWPSIPIAMGVQAPPVGSPVWVMFEGDDRSRPVWVGTWRTSKQGGLDPDLHFGGVVAETTYGLSPSNGLAQTVSRSDHTHGSPPEVDLDPVMDAIDDVSDALGAHAIDTTNVHGIPDTSLLATDDELATALATHAATPHGSAGDVLALETIFWTMVNP